MIDKPLSFVEPELPEVPDVDRPIVRNVIYTAWALHADGDPCMGWQVQSKPDGYLVLVSFGKRFSICLQDLQMVADVNPLRIDSIVLRSQEGSVENLVGAVMAVKVLDQQQPVMITESEVVRVKKRHRGFFSAFV